MKVLQGSSGQFDSVVYDTVAIPENATYRIWVRHFQKPDVRGTFKLIAIQNGNEIASKEFDLESTSQVVRDSRLGMDYVWDYVDSELPAGNITLKFILKKW
ncbi:MAG: hypothetical protein ACP5JO_08895 [Candidatus Ratteibacteria bacterium]